MAADLTVTQYDREYPARIGRLFANLGVLEFSLRVALYLMDTPQLQRRPNTWRIASLAVGDHIEESWLTSWSYLTGLIQAYNERQDAVGLRQIDGKIADLRNAMAHGTITAGDDREPYSLIKFSPVTDGAALVVAKYVLTYEWIGEQTDRVYNASLQVNQRIQELR